MHRDIIHQLDEAVTEVFAVMLNLACTSEQTGDQEVARLQHNLVMPKTGVPAPNQYYTASVLFSGPLEGRFCLHIDEPTAAELTSNLMGVPLHDVSPGLCADTAGELCNMIAGTWKKRHPTELAASQLSCPVVTHGLCRHATEKFREGAEFLYHFNGYHMTLRLALN